MPDELDPFHDPTREVDSRHLQALAARATHPTEELQLDDLIAEVRGTPTPTAVTMAAVAAVEPVAAVELPELPQLPAPPRPVVYPVYPVYRGRSRLPFALGAFVAAAAAALSVVYFI